MIDLQQFDSAKDAAQEAANLIRDRLGDYRSDLSLLLLSGGSSTEVVYWLTTDLSINDTNSVMVGQIDERYGPVDHADSNWKKLVSKGLNPSLFRSSFELLRMGISAADIAKTYNARLHELLDETDYAIGVLGIGDDGHIASIMPSSEQEFERFLGAEDAVSFQASDHERITLTARALLQLDEIVVYASGAEKANIVYSLLDTDSPIHEQPAQILKKCKKVTLFYGKE